MDGVAANPFGELAVRNQKYASNCTELHLANRNIGWLQGFDRFVNLEVLWLNDNKLRKLNGLEKNFRLRALHAHNNQLSTLKDSSVSRLVFLDELMLFNNHLEDLHATLKTLSRLRHLKHLDMFGNPLSEEKDYRLHVIKQLPHLEVLDRHVIEWEERQAAKEMFEGKKMSNLGFMKRKPLWKNPPTQPLACLSILTKEMYKDIEVYKRASKEESERRERAAVQGRRAVSNTTAPLARTVEEMNEKTMGLNDVLSKIDGEYGTSLATDVIKRESSRSKAASETAVSHAGANQAAAVAAHEQLRTKRDFVAMKRYRSPAARVDPVTAQDWLATRTFSSASGGAPALGTTIALDADLFASYETRKAQNKLKTDLTEWSIEM